MEYIILVYNGYIFNYYDICMDIFEYYATKLDLPSSATDLSSENSNLVTEGCTFLIGGSLDPNVTYNT